MKLIFDLGANVGGNLEYYLTKADKVVAVEANPILCETIKNNFSEEINSGNLILVEACLTESNENKIVDFYVNKYESGLSSFAKPKIDIHDFVEIQVASITLRNLIDNFGFPDMIKIDLEGYDKVIINYMIQYNLLPNYLQFENQGLDVLSKLVELNIYKSYNIVSFYNYSKVYKNKSAKFAGPIGNDIKSPWLYAKNLLRLYKSIKFTWLDIHLSKDDIVKKDEIDDSYYQYKEPIWIKIKRMIPSTLKSKIKNIIKYRVR